MRSASTKARQKGKHQQPLLSAFTQLPFGLVQYLDSTKEGGHIEIQGEFSRLNAQRLGSASTYLCPQMGPAGFTNQCRGSLTTDVFS